MSVKWPSSNDPENRLVAFYDVAPPASVLSIPIHFCRPEDEDDEVSKFFGSSQGHGQQEETEQEERISRSPSPLESTNRNSVDGMDPALPMFFVVCHPTDLMPVVLY